MDNVITFKSNYRLCDELPDGEQAPFLQVAEKSGNSRVFRMVMNMDVMCYAEGERLDLVFIGCKVTVRGRHLNELLRNIDSVTCIYEFAPLHHRKVSPWEPCIESVTIEELPITDRDKKLFLDQVRVARSERYRKQRTT